MIFRLVKYVSRVGHMLSTSILTGIIFMNYIFDTHSLIKKNSLYRRLHITTSIILTITGFANIFLIKGGKKLKPEHRMLEFKFLLTLLLTPLINPIIWMFTSTNEGFESLRNAVWFYLCISMYFFGTAIK